MKANLSRMLRSGMALLLAFCMAAGFVPTVAFAAEEINYVSIGDSMANGYCFEGYKQGEAGIDFLNGIGVYGVDAYPDQFAAYLESTGATVNHTKLAVSALRAEDLNFLLGGREEPTDGWEDQVNGYTRIYDDEVLSAFYQDAVKKADVITLGVGNASFGAYMLHRVTDALGVFGASLDGDEVVDLEEALIDLDAEQKELILKVYGMLEAKLMGNVPAEMAEKYNLKKVCDIMAYTAAGFLLNYKGSLEQIIKLNPKAEIVLVGLMNTTYGMKVVMDDMPGLEGVAPLMIGDVMDELFNMLNAYMTGLPTAMQKTGKWTEAKFYYAEQPNPLFISQQFAALKANGWDPVQDGRLSGAIVRDRNIDAYNGSLREMIASALRMNLPEIDFTDVVQYEDDMASWNGNETDWYTYIVDPLTGAMNHEGETKMSVAIYLGIEDAIAESCDTLEITLGGLEKLASGNLLDVFAGLDGEAMYAGGPEGIRNGLGSHLTDSDAKKGLCKIYALFKVGNGMSVHPTPEGHDQIAKSVIAAYKDGYTVEDETVKNVKIVLDELYNLIQTYGPEAAAQVWAQWEEYGYVDAFETSVSELKGMLTDRYTYYTETALPAIKVAIDALNAEKDNLSAELAALKAALEAKKAELAEVVKNIEIGSVHTPDINIDVELGNNQQTRVPENDCTVEGEGIEAELEAAVKDLEHAVAVIEALIADIEADIADLVALAEQIVAAVAELEKTIVDVAAAVEDLEAAVLAVIDVIKNSDGVVNQLIKSFEAARDAANAAVNVLELTIGTAETMMDDIYALIEKVCADADAMYNKFVTELPGCIEQIPEEAMMLIAGSVYAAQQAYEANKEAIEAALKAELAALAEEHGISTESLKAELAALAEEYGISEESLKAELAAIKALIAEEIEKKYAEIEAGFNAQIEAKKAEAAAKLVELEAELKAYEAELAGLAADAAQDVIDGIRAQIDRVNTDIATVKADLEHAVTHLENAAQIAYEEIVAEVNKAYEEAVAVVEQKLAELKAAYDAAVASVEQKLAELKAAYDQAVEDLTAAADQAIAELTEQLEKKLEELYQLAEGAVDGILDAIRGVLTSAQEAIKEILKGNLEAVEDLTNALLEMSGDAIADAVEALIDAVMALIEEASTADLVIDDSFKYVAIGDGSAATESYVEKLAAALNAEAAENGVDEIDVVNNAYVGNTVIAERENLSDVTDADLITIGFSNVEILNSAIDNALNGVELDWAAIVGAENVHYVEELLAEVALKFAEAGIEGEYADMVNAVIESYAYSAILYATELPQLINEINAVNPDALVIIVGMYNPMSDAVIALDENVTMDIGEYIDYLVQGVAVHGLAYSILTGNSIYVDAPAVQTVNTDTELGVFDLMLMIKNGFEELYPNAAGDDYIAAEIADALNITYVKSVLFSDVNMDGIVDQSDVALLFAYVLNTETLSEQQLANADVNFDGVVDQSDLTKLFSYVLGQIESL